MLFLVTGAAGFIGSHLCERLLYDGHEVIGVDSFLDHYPRKVKENNVLNIIHNPNLQFVDGDLCDLSLSELLSGVDGVFHQAAIAGVRSSWGTLFDRYIKNNVLATQLLLEACMELDIKKFVYASSSSVYGDAQALPVTEQTPTAPISPYGVTKLAGEHLAHLYYKNYGLPVVSLRYFTIYGPRQRPDMGFHKFIYKTLKGEEIEIYGDGEQTRDFTYIDSAVEANISAFFNGIGGGVYNIGGGSRVRLIEAIGIIEDITGKKAKLKFVERQKGDAKHTFSDVSKAKKDFEYSPQLSLREGLERHCEWLEKNIELYDF
ncbi:MAG: NAD-dependent epimerase/dehydratase family protein [Candidatus Dadabacteria bacterium]|nr:NAD-dependent epimerase/dehydratase family protein [Candidatus Dadabacteria bacterium]